MRSQTKLLAPLAAALLLCACAHRAHLSWPWHAKAPPPPQPVQALVISSEDGVPVHAFQQYYRRNTLLVDLSGAASTGTIVLRRRAGASWPVRLAFRVHPAQISLLEIEAAERLLLPTSPEAGDTVELDVAPGVYASGTAAIRVHW